MTPLKRAILCAAVAIAAVVPIGLAVAQDDPPSDGPALQVSEETKAEAAETYARAKAECEELQASGETPSVCDRILNGDFFGARYAHEAR